MNRPQPHKPQFHKPQPPNYEVGDEISYAAANGMRYGSVVRVLPDAIEVQFEDGRKEIHKTRDRVLRLLKKAHPAPDDRARPKIRDIEDVRRSEIRRGR